MFDKENLKQAAIGAGAVTVGAIVGKKVLGYSEQPLVAVAAIVAGGLAASKADRKNPYLAHLGTALVAAGATGFVSNPKTVEKFPFMKNYLGAPIAGNAVSGLDGLGSGELVYGPDGQMYMVESQNGISGNQFRQDEHGNLFQVGGLPMGSLDDDLDDLDGLGEADIEDLTGLDYADDLEDLDGLGDLDDEDDLDGLGEIDDLDEDLDGLNGEDEAIMAMS
ncbi:hypothetical protein [Flammeovirga sp. EKP202]|uniref:hypothetical protein n=1 Tax=Flammeovirga sp. EKP202 TaxID=2770592 RepID=UPI00165F59D8|nr:hypothetical protein [Flammeovirga sp. EKP202]MBD0403207.1 hypothetical protein [Flammeovirga sp. EKP202]